MSTCVYKDFLGLVYICLFSMALLLTKDFQLAETPDDAVATFEELWTEIEKWEKTEQAYEEEDLEELLLREAALQSLLNNIK